MPVSPSREPVAPVRLRGDDRALFASDMHLAGQDPATVTAFIEALDRHGADATHLFLLGDLFDLWVGDDNHDAVADALGGCLERLAGGGREVWLMRGNRDFLIDTGAPTFSERHHARLLPDPCLIELFGERVLLAHGDALCIDDVPYQQLRAQMRSAQWQRSFLAQPLAGRLDFARNLRSRSEHEKQGKTEMLMDVNETEVRRVMREAGVTTMIHGHTHRPAHHRDEADGVTLHRWVLPDWDAAAGRGGFLRVDARGWRFERP